MVYAPKSAVAFGLRFIKELIGRGFVWKIFVVIVITGDVGGARCHSSVQSSRGRRPVRTTDLNRTVERWSIFGSAARQAQLFRGLRQVQARRLHPFRGLGYASRRYRYDPPH